MAQKSGIIQLTDKTFISEVLHSRQPVLVQFGAQWCGSCHLLQPMIDDLVRQFEGRIRVAWLDVDANQRMKEKYGIGELPTLLFFRNGEVIDFIVGAVPRKILQHKINAVAGQTSGGE